MFPQPRQWPCSPHRPFLFTIYDLQFTSYCQHAVHQGVCAAWRPLRKKIKDACGKVTQSELIMAINLNKPDRWRPDIIRSVDMYNEWFIAFAPKAFRDKRTKTAETVGKALISTDYLRNVSPALLKEHPSVIQILRMSTCPPIAQDRLVGLAGVSKNLVKCMEDETNPCIPPKMNAKILDKELKQIGDIIEKLADRDILEWLGRGDDPTEIEIDRAARIIADRLCGALTNPIIRNAQEKRQLELIGNWLDKKGYKLLQPKHRLKFNQMQPGTYTFRMNVPVNMNDSDGTLKTINIPVDAVIKPIRSKQKDLPLFIEAKSAGDFTNVNKRRKEESKKISQLRATYGDKIRFALFLCGYFNPGYLGYAAYDGIDWVWEHRVDDLAGFGL